MASLLERAEQIQEDLREKAVLDAIPAAERDRIYEDIDRSVASKKMKIREDTFAFTSVKNDIALPFIINISAFLLISALSLYFYFNLNKDESLIISGSGNVEITESKLIEALKEESEERLSGKEREIEEIKGNLEAMQLEKDRLILESRELAIQLERELRESFDRELEEERLRLQAEGLSLEQVEQRIDEVETLKEAEFQIEIESINKKLEQERLAKEETLNALITQYEQSLLEARQEHLALEESLREQLEGERDTAVNQLARFDEQQKQEQLILGQIFSRYSTVNELIRIKQFDSAIQNLDRLEDFLNQDSVAIHSGVLFRREIDLFLIESLRRLIINEKSNELIAPEVQPESALVLESISSLVEEGNQYYSLGNYEPARASYLTAISQLPALDQGYRNLQRMEEQEEQSLQDQFLVSLNEGEEYFQFKEYESAVEKYRQALEYLVKDDDLVKQVVDRLVDAGLGIETADGNVLISSEDLELINEAKVQQKIRSDQLQGIANIEEQYKLLSVNDMNEEDSTDSLVILLNIKLLIKEILASETIRAEYPDLHDKMEIYLEAYGKEKETEGRNDAVKEIIEIIGYLSKEMDSEASEPSVTKNDHFLEFLQNLKDLL